MKGPRNLSLFFEGSKSLRTTDPPERMRGRWCLGLHRDSSDPNWWFILRGSHRSEDAIAWTAAKLLLGNRVGLEDRWMLLFLAAERDIYFQLVQTIQRKLGQLNKEMMPIRCRMKLPIGTYVQLDRIVRSYRPCYYPYRHWQPQKLPPVRYIGVGYKDHGNISTSPAWQDQVLTDGEDQQSEIGGNLGTLLDLLPSLPFPKDGEAEESKDRTKRRNK